MIIDRLLTAQYIKCWNLKNGESLKIVLILYIKDTLTVISINAKYFLNCYMCIIIQNIHFKTKTIGIYILNKCVFYMTKYVS